MLLEKEEYELYVKETTGRSIFKQLGSVVRYFQGTLPVFTFFLHKKEKRKEIKRVRVNREKIHF